MKRRKRISLDWGRKAENTVWFTGRKIDHGLPPVNGDFDIYVENMPAEQALDYIKAGSKVFRCGTNIIAKMRKDQGLEKTHEIDCRLIFDLAKTDDKIDDVKKKKFRPYTIEHPLFQYYQFFKQFQKMLIAAENRMRYHVHPEVRVIVDNLKESTKRLDATVKEEMQKYPIFVEWLQDIKGISHITAAGLIAVIKDVHKFDTVSKLWKYLGLDVQDGHMPKLKKGQTAGFHTKGRALLIGIIGDSFIKQRTPEYRPIYDATKARLLAEHEKTGNRLNPKYPLGHASNMARRKMVKMFVKDLWVKWRGLEPANVEEFCVVSLEEERKSEVELLEIA
tara:strand:- start:8219 stop:9223 length:1005 start_codon:yes stop_codon:yes gene_type:complete